MPDTLYTNETSITDTCHCTILATAKAMINLAHIKNEIASQLYLLTKTYQKAFNIKISDYTKYQLSYFYFLCQQQSDNKSDDIFFTLLPEFFSNNPHLALSFISNSIHPYITYSIPIKVQIFSKSQISRIWQYASAEVINHKDYCAIYIEQFSLKYREYTDIKDKIVLDFIHDIILRYKDIFISDFSDSRKNMLSLFAVAYPFLSATDINKMLPLIVSHPSYLYEFFAKLNSLNLNGLDTELINSAQAKFVIQSMYNEGNVI